MANNGIKVSLEILSVKMLAAISSDISGNRAGRSIDSGRYGYGNFSRYEHSGTGRE